MIPRRPLLCKLFVIAAMVIFHVPVSHAAGNWNLVWSDEFGYTGLPDTTRWGYEVGLVRNDELQYYTKDRSENARIENGMLVIEGRKESYQGAAYTSASLRSKGKGDWLYGRIEVAAKVPTGKGTWPAIWMMPTDNAYGGWPRSGEIDIMENVGFDPSRIHCTVHTDAYNHTKGTQKGGSKIVSAPWQSFHRYQMEWDPDSIRMFVDDTLVFTFRNEHRGWSTWPFDKRFYLILNFAIGGSWGGAQGVDTSIFPQKFYIDYVRVYRGGTTAVDRRLPGVIRRVPPPVLRVMIRQGIRPPEAAFRVWDPLGREIGGFGRWPWGMAVPHPYVTPRESR